MITHKSQNGWDASPERAAIHVKNYMVPGTTRHIACAKAVAPLMVGFAGEFHALIEPIDEGTFDDWGYNFAPIPGSKTLSNHASGTAMDINATLHPWKKKGTFDNAKVPMIRALAKKYGLRWGGDYLHGFTDEMHFEVTIKPNEATALIAKLKLPEPKEKK